jgi:hypothetical protein
VDILDNQDLQRELRLLERRNRPGGKVSVDHPPKLHDDTAAAVCRAIANASRTKLNTAGILTFGQTRFNRKYDWISQGDGDNGLSPIEAAWDSGALSRKFWDT